MAHIVLYVPDATPQTYENVEQFVVKNGVLIFTALGHRDYPIAAASSFDGTMSSTTIPIIPKRITSL